MKTKFIYQVYCTDADGSERKACQVEACSEADAKNIAKRLGIKHVTDAVKL